MDTNEETPPENVGESPAPTPPAPAPSESKGRENASSRPEKRLDEEELRPSELGGLARRLAAVFVPFPDLDKFLEDARHTHKRVIVISGDESRGRLACAVWLGMNLTAREAELTGNEPVWRLPERTLDRYDLDTFMRSPALEEGSAYVLEKPFRAGMQIDSLPELQHDALNKRLAVLNSWLILTADERSGATPSTWHHRFCWFPIPETLTPDFLADVLARHLEWAGGVGSELPDKVKAAAAEFVRAHSADGNLALDTAPRIYRFSFGILETKIAADTPNFETALTRLASDIADESRPRQTWFASLSANAQFLALLAGAFENIRRSDLEDIYYAQVQRIREQEPGLLEDPRRRGFEELYREIRIDSGGAELHFIAESYRREVLRQMGFRHHLLWEVVMSVKEWMASLNEPWQWSQRALLGSAVARLGIHRPEKLSRLLDDLAGNEFATIASLPGYILRGICLLDDPRHQFVCELLERWVASDRTDQPHTESSKSDAAALIWAAADATQRVYVELAERLQEREFNVAERGRLHAVQRRLEDIIGVIAASKRRYVESRAQKWAEDEYNHVLSNAVLAMFRAQPEDMVTALLHWLKGLPERQKKTSSSDAPAAPPAAGPDRESLGSAIVAAFLTRRLFEAHRKTESLTVQRRDVLLKLVGPVLQSDRGVVNRILEILRDWVHPEMAGGADLAETRQQWRGAIRSALLQACTSMSEGQRRGLRRGLMTLWLGTSKREVRLVAQSVICRTRLLEGVPTDVPGGAWGGIFVDASAVGRVNDTSHRLFWELFELLRPQVDLLAAQLGNGQELCRPGQAPDVDALPGRPYTLRTLAPWLERLSREDAGPAAFYLPIFWESLVDAQDAQDAVGETPLLSFQIEGWQKREDQSVAEMFHLLGFPDHWISATNEQGFESMLLTVERAVSPCLSRRLAARDAGQWYDTLRAHAVFADATDADRRTHAEDSLEQFVQDDVGGTETSGEPRGEDDRGFLPPDRWRIALGIVQWLAADDLAATMRLLLKWIKTEAGPRESVGRAAAIMLLRIHSERMLPVGASPAADAPPVESFTQLLDFAPALARRRSRLGVEAFLAAARHWMTDAGWADMLLRDAKKTGAPSDGGLPYASILMSMLAALPWWMHVPVAKTLFEWIKPAAGEKVESIPAAAFALSLRLRYDLALRARFRVGEDDFFPGRPEKFTLVILCGGQDEEANTRVQDLAAKLYARWERERLPGLDRYVFVEAGSRVPLAVSREGVPREAFHLAGTRVPTLAPVVEALAPSEVGLVVVIASEGLVDWEDLPEWLAEAQKLRLFRIKSSARQRLGDWMNVSWCELDASSADGNERKLLEQLRPYFQAANP